MSQRAVGISESDKLKEIVQSLDGFCYSIAHDLRAPLRALGGFSTELFDEYSKALDAKGRVIGTSKPVAAD